MAVELPTMYLTNKQKQKNPGGSWRSSLITKPPAHSFQGNTARTEDEKEQSSRSRGKVQQRRSVAEPDAGLGFILLSLQTNMGIQGTNEYLGGSRFPTN